MVVKSGTSLTGAFRLFTNLGRKFRVKYHYAKYKWGGQIFGKEPTRHAYRTSTKLDMLKRWETSIISNARPDQIVVAIIELFVEMQATEQIPEKLNEVRPCIYKKWLDEMALTVIGLILKRDQVEAASLCTAFPDWKLVSGYSCVRREAFSSINVVWKHGTLVLAFMTCRLPGLRKTRDSRRGLIRESALCRFAATEIHLYTLHWQSNIFRHDS